MNETLNAISLRRAIKLFEPVEISPEIREQILHAARQAPSSFNTQPYRFYWIGTANKKTAVAKLCMGQSPAATASALVVAVADIGSLTTTSKAQAEWMRSRSEFSEAKIRDYERTAKIGRILFMPGPFNVFAVVKWAILRLVNLFKMMGMPPLFRHDLFKMGHQGNNVGLRESDDCRRSVGTQYVSDGRL